MNDHPHGGFAHRTALIAGWCGLALATVALAEEEVPKCPDHGKAVPKETDRSKFPPFISMGKEDKHVCVTVVATYDTSNYGMNFNGASKGSATYTIPTGWTVNVHFYNNSPVPHSLVVIEEERVKKIQVGEPYFDGASSPEPTKGMSEGTVNFSFVPDEAGDYAFACGFPIHSANGHWIKLTVSDEVEKPVYEVEEAEASP